MATLDLSQRATIRRDKHPRFETELSCHFEKDVRSELTEELKECFEKNHELRLILPEQWTIYFKLRTAGSSRLSLAHPSEKEWVATIALSPEHARAVLEQLRTDASLRISDLGTTSGLINFSLLID